MTTIDNAGGEGAVEAGETADVDLVLRTRSGDRGAFAELWYRHYRSGIAVARAVTSAHEPDDLVQEAYSRIYQSILRGGGPTGSFRAYLFASIRNTAAAWGRAGRETAFDEFETIEDPTTNEEATEAALDRGLTHRAFRSLPSRWQEVLWYTEIEQMKPAEVAPLLGMKPTAVAQLAFRAREGLREAWIQAHLQSVADGSDCQWTIEHLGAHARANLSRRDQRKVDEHLGDCTRCSIVAAEAKEVSSRLALVLLPLTLGVTGAASYLATLQGGGVAVVALAAGAAPAAAAPAAGASLIPALGAGSSGSSAAGASTAAGGSSAAGATTAGATTAGATSAAGASTAGATTVAASGVAASGVAATGAAVGAGAAGVAAAGGIFTTVGGVIGATAAAVFLAGSALTASVVLPGVLADDSGANSSDTSVVSVDGTSEADGSAPATIADEDAASSTEDTSAEDTSAEDSSTVVGSRGSDDAEPPAEALPPGIPSIGTADVQYEGTQPTFAVPVTGAPGATVEVLLNGAIKATVVLDESGFAATAVQPNYGHVTSDARVQWRYRAGDLRGTPATARLSELGDLVAVLAVMQASTPGNVASVPGTANGPSKQTGSGNGQGSGSANGSATSQGGATNGNAANPGTKAQPPANGQPPVGGQPVTGNGSTGSENGNAGDRPGAGSDSPATDQGAPTAPGEQRTSGGGTPANGSSTGAGSPGNGGDTPSGAPGSDPQTRAVTGGGRPDSSA